MPPKESPRERFLAAARKCKNGSVFGLKRDWSDVAWEINVNGKVESSPTLDGVWEKGARMLERFAGS